MGIKTALQLAQSFCRLRGLPVPTTLVGATDAGVLQLLELMNETGNDLALRPFQQLTRRLTLTALATEDQGDLYTIFSGVSPLTVTVDSFWNDTRQLPIYGPLSDEEYQRIQVALPSGPFLQYKFMGDHLYITGGITAGDTLSMMYKTVAWVETIGGLGIYTTELVADANVPVFPDDLFALGLAWRYLRAKKLDYSSELAEFTAKVMDRRGEPARKVKLHQSGAPIPRPGIIVPAGNWTI